MAERPADPSVAPPARGRPPVRGRFVVLDGVDGCGKSTQAARLVGFLAERAGDGRDVLHLREPGSTRVGEVLRELLLARDLHLSPEVETLLFAAARRQMLDERVAPAVLRGDHVVCERFHPSTYAYQAVAGALDEERVLALLAGWASSVRPDLVVLLDVDVDRAAARRGAATDRIEARGLAFQRRVAEGYRRWAERASDVGRVVVVDGDRDPDAVARDVRREVERVL